jgi:hypothetical protein
MESMTLAAKALDTECFSQQNGSYRIFAADDLDRIAAAVVVAGRPDVLAAARYVVSLDDALRQYPGQRNSASLRKDRARLGGALTIWEALTGLPPGDSVEYARRLVAEADQEPDSPCLSGCRPSEGDVCGGPRCS